MLGILLTAYSGWQMWNIHRFGHEDDGSKADCAIVLGAAAYHDKPSPVLKARLDHAISLYKSGRVGAILLTGGFGKGADYAESEVALNYCLKQGVPKKDLFLETNSKTTEQNIMEANKMMSESGFQNALIVSDPWHLKRACDMAAHYGFDAKPSATKNSRYKSDESKINFIWREFYKLHLWRFN